MRRETTKAACSDAAKIKHAKPYWIFKGGDNIPYIGINKQRLSLFLISGGGSAAPMYIGISSSSKLGHHLNLLATPVTLLEEWNAAPTIHTIRWQA